MPPPTTYDEDEFASYMLLELGDVGRALALSIAPTVSGDHGHLTEPLNDVMLDLGIDDISEVAGPLAIRRLRALGAVHAWRYASKAAAARYDMKDGSTTLNRSQYKPMIDKNLAAAERIASGLGVLANGNQVQVSIGRVRYPQDPYRPVDLSAEGLRIQGES